MDAWVYTALGNVRQVPEDIAAEMAGDDTAAREVGLGTGHIFFFAELTPVEV